MSVVLVDNAETVSSLWPLGSLRSIADIRIGCFTNRERHAMDGDEVFVRALPELQPLYQEVPPANAREFPANRLPDGASINRPWEVFQWNDRYLRADIAWLQVNRKLTNPSPGPFLTAPQNIFMEEGADLEKAFINASEGPVYLGRSSLVMDGASIRGPFALCEGSVVKAGARIYGATTIGPYCTVGGEIKNSIFFGYSNKAHDGYLGDSVIGYWCNLGAGTTNSNIKNTAGAVRFGAESAGLKCGLIMGDHSRAAINTSFNTGTMVGTGCNVFGGNIPRLLPDFSWGVCGESYATEKAIGHISNWMRLKGRELSVAETEVIRSRSRR